MSSARIGRAVLRAFLNVQAVPPSTATVVFDATKRAGAATDLALRIRRFGRLAYRHLLSFAELALIAESDLHLWCLPALEAVEALQVIRDPAGNILGVEEQVGVAAPVLTQCGQIWRHLNPSALEACAIDSSDQAAYVPMTESDHRSLLEAAGHHAELHDKAFRCLEAVGLIRRHHGPALGEDIVYSPYVWGTEAIDIAAFYRNLPPNEREVIGSLSRIAAERPGSPIDRLEGGERLLQSARKVGLIQSTRVVTTGGNERAFAFSPALEHQLGVGSTDAIHERKLFVAHILYGHLYGFPGTGRIETPLRLLGALINRGTVGPTTSIRTDYPLLEARGIVRVDKTAGDMAFLRLVKEDVAKDSLELLERALGDEPERGNSASPVDALWLPGSFTTPERDRQQMPEINPGAEQDMLVSTLEELREQTRRQLRGEAW